MKYLKLFENFDIFDPEGIDTITEDEWEILRFAEELILKNGKRQNPNWEIKVEPDLKSIKTNDKEVILILRQYLVGMDNEMWDSQVEVDKVVLIIKRNYHHYALRILKAIFTIIHPKTMGSEYQSIELRPEADYKFVEYYATEDGKLYGDFAWYQLK
jgi:hypothetical protein